MRWNGASLPACGSAGDGDLKEHKIQGMNSRTEGDMGHPGLGGVSLSIAASPWEEGARPCSSPGTREMLFARGLGHQGGAGILFLGGFTPFWVGSCAGGSCRPITPSVPAAAQGIKGISQHQGLSREHFAKESRGLRLK